MYTHCIVYVSLKADDLLAHIPSTEDLDLQTISHYKYLKRLIPILHRGMYRPSSILYMSHIERGTYLYTIYVCT